MEKTIHVKHDQLCKLTVEYDQMTEKGKKL